MTTLSIDLPEVLITMIEEIVAREFGGDVNLYVEGLILADLRRRDEEEMAASGSSEAGDR